MTIEYAARLMDEKRNNNEVERRGFYKVKKVPAFRYSSVLSLKKLISPYLPIRNKNISQHVSCVTCFYLKVTHNIPSTALSCLSKASGYLFGKKFTVFFLGSHYFGAPPPLFFPCPNSFMIHMYRGADTSLARPGRKQATSTKL